MELSRRLQDEGGDVVIGYEIQSEEEEVLAVYG
jgi:hypothetical protein